MLAKCVGSLEFQVFEAGQVVALMPKIGVAWEKEMPQKKKKIKLSFVYEHLSSFWKKRDAAKPREGKGYSLPDSESSYVCPDCFFSTCNLKFPPKSWSPVCAAACGASMIALLK